MHRQVTFKTSSQIGIQNKGALSAPILNVFPHIFPLVQFTGSISPSSVCPKTASKEVRKVHPSVRRNTYQAHPNYCYVYVVLCACDNIWILRFESFLLLYLQFFVTIQFTAIAFYFHRLHNFSIVHACFLGKVCSIAVVPFSFRIVW